MQISLVTHTTALHCYSRSPVAMPRRYHCRSGMRPRASIAGHHTSGRLHARRTAPETPPYPSDLFSLLPPPPTGMAGSVMSAMLTLLSQKERVANQSVFLLYHHHQNHTSIIVTSPPLSLTDLRGVGLVSEGHLPGVV